MLIPEQPTAEPSLADEIRSATDEALRSGRLDRLATALHHADIILPGLAAAADLLALHCRVVRAKGRPANPESQQALATARAVAFKRHIREIARGIKLRPRHDGRFIDVQTYFALHLRRRVGFGAGVAIDLFRPDQSAAVISSLIGPAVDERVIRSGGSVQARRLLAAEEVRPKTSDLKTDFLDSRNAEAAASWPAL